MTKEFKKEWAKFRNQNIIAFIEQVVTDNCSSFGVNKAKIVETISNDVIEESERKEEYLLYAIAHKRKTEQLEAKYKALQQKYNQLKKKK